VFTFWQVVEQLLLGVGVGILSAALGLGGGILMVPAFLLFVEGMDPHTAKGTSLFIIIFVSLFNAWRINRGLPAIPWRLALTLAVGSIVGGYAGAFLTDRMSPQAVLWIFLVLLLVLAVYTFLLKPVQVRAEQVRQRLVLALLIGLFAGLVGGATGTGGGIVLIPLALMAGIITNERVVGLSMLVMVFTSVAGSVAHLQAPQVYPAAWTVGHVYLALVPLVFLGALAGSEAGKVINRHLTIQRRRIAMGGMLLILCAQILYRIFHA